MRYILTFALALLVSINVSAEEITEQDYIDEAKSMASQVLVSKFYLSNGKYGYNLVISTNYLLGQLEARASELCGKKGYVLVKETVHSMNLKRQIIQCNE